MAVARMPFTFSSVLMLCEMETAPALLAPYATPDITPGASAYAVALPMPLDPPVTIATCPFSLPSATRRLLFHLIHRRERAGHLHEFDGVAERVLDEEARPVVDHARLADRHPPHVQ